MLAKIVGSVDLFSAAVLIAIFVGISIVLTTLLARQTRHKTEREFDLAVLKTQLDAKSTEHKQNIDREIELGKIVAKKDVEIRQIENRTIDVTRE